MSILTLGPTFGLVIATPAIAARSVSSPELEQVERERAKAYEEVLHHLEKSDSSVPRGEKAKAADAILSPSSKKLLELEAHRANEARKKTSTLKAKTRAEHVSPSAGMLRSAGLKTSGPPSDPDKPAASPEHDPRPQFELDGSQIPKEVEFGGSPPSRPDPRP